jgi:excisionase family DNA binding protein
MNKHNMLYNIKEACQILNVCRKTVDRALKDGTLKSRRIGPSIRFSRADLENYAGGPIFWDIEKPDTPESRGAIPPEIIKTLETEIEGVKHGTVSLTVYIRDHRPRFVVGRERSFFPDADKEAVSQSRNSP